MKTETFKIIDIDIDTALTMTEAMNIELVLKVVGDYVWRRKLTNKKEYQILDIKAVNGRYSFENHYLITNDDGRNIWVAAEYIELV
jgi:hypothetical protein